MVLCLTKMESFRPKSSRSVGEVWSTQSFIKTRYGSSDVSVEYGILFAADVTTQFSVGVDELGFEELSKGIYYPYNNPSQWKEFDSSIKIDLSGCSKEKFCLYYFSPHLNSTVSHLNPAVLGETGKWVPMSSNRIEYISIDVSNYAIDLYFKPVPSVEIFNISYILTGELKTQNCSTGPSLKPFCRLYG